MSITQTLSAALPTEQRAYAGDLAVLLDDLAAGVSPADVARRLAEQPLLRVALASLVGQHLDLAGRPLHIAGNVGTLQQITISGGYVDRIVGASITIQLPPAPRQIDPVAAQELLAALPLNTIPPLAPLPELQRMPFSRNPLFVGREADLHALARTVKGEGSAAAIGQAAAATGIGGIGKTNLATEFVHRYGQFFAGGVFWMSFADPAGVPGEIAACGAALDIPGFADLKLNEQVQRVQVAWQQPLPRLLIFDNCDDANPGQAESLIQQWKPTTGGCRVLITSRRGSWSKSLGITAQPLGVLSRAESIALLRKHRPDLTEDDPDLDAIAAEVGDLPLALHLAGSFLETYRDSPTFGDPADFLADLRDQRLLNHDALKGIDVTPSSTNHDLHVARTFALSYNRLNSSDAVDALALRLLARADCLAPGEQIPRDLLLATLEIAEGDRAGHRQSEKGVLRLVALGLLDAADDTLLLHRLLHAFVDAVADDPESQGAVEQVLIRAAYQRLMTGYPCAMQPIVVHLRYAVDHTEGREDERTASLCSNLANYLEMVGDYLAARPLFERTLAIIEYVFGFSHPNTAISLNNLAGLLESVGDYAEARPLYERALAIREQALGPIHPNTATSLNNLAGLLESVGNYAEARSLFERALAIREQTLGPSHPDTATSLNNLAELFRAVGDYAAARPLYERALAIYEQALGPSHPQTASSLNNLAGLLCVVGDYAAARPLYERALAIREQALGPSHPDTAQSLNNLAYLLQAVGDYAAARPLYERAIAIREQALGPSHPDTAQSLNNLAVLFYAVGNYAAARPFLERALAIREQALGPSHPDTASTLNNLAALLQAVCDYAAARPLLERALAIYEQTLGPSHPNTASSLNNLAALLESVGDYAAARPLYERALLIYEQVLGPSHPDTASSLNNLAINCFYQEQFEIAADLMRRALAIWEQQLSPEHPDTQSSRQSLAAIEQRLAGTDAPLSPDAQIAQITLQAEEAVAHTLADGDDVQRTALHMRLAEIAQQAEDGETDGSPWLVLAAHLRTLMARLDADEPPEYVALRQRAEAAVSGALAEGNPEDRAALAQKLTVTADAYAGGQSPDSPAATLAAHLRTLAERLRQS